MKRFIPSLMIAIMINLALFTIMKALVSPKHLTSPDTPETGQTITFVHYDPPEVEPRVKRQSRTKPQNKAPVLSKKHRSEDKPKLKTSVPKQKSPTLNKVRTDTKVIPLRTPKPTLLPKLKKKKDPIKSLPEKIFETEKGEKVKVESIVAVPEKNAKATEESLEPVATPVLLAVMKTESKPPPLPQKASPPSDIIQTKTHKIPIETDVSPLVRISPRYPAWALRSEITGLVVIQFTITPDGFVSEPRIVKSEPDDVFDRSALRALKQWQFKPLLRNGQPTTRRAIQSFNFALKKG